MENKEKLYDELKRLEQKLRKSNNNVEYLKKQIEIKENKEKSEPIKKILSGIKELLKE